MRSNVSKDGSEINQRGFENVNNGFDTGCFACHHSNHVNSLTSSAKKDTAALQFIHAPCQRQTNPWWKKIRSRLPKKISRHLRTRPKWQRHRHRARDRKKTVARSVLPITPSFASVLQ